MWQRDSGIEGTADAQTLADENEDAVRPSLGVKPKCISNMLDRAALYSGLRRHRLATKTRFDAKYGRGAADSVLQGQA